MKKLIAVLMILSLFVISGCGDVEEDTETMREAEPDVADEVEEPNLLDEPPEVDVPEPEELLEAVYDPEIDPADFVSGLDNKYMNLEAGKVYVYEGETEDGVERVEVVLTYEKKTVMGVETTVVQDREWLNNELVEDTKDWFAQDKEGNIWYFGEDSKELIDGKVASTEGSWEAGVDGAKPGIIVKADPEVGDEYRQEYYEDEAEDMGEVLSLDESVEVTYGTFKKCMKTKDWNPLEEDSEEHKYYCPEVGVVVLEVSLEDDERIQLIEIKEEETPDVPEEEPEELVVEMSVERAKEIALEEVPGEVTDVDIEKKKGKAVYVIEIDPDKGSETDVLIDMDTGEVLEIEI